MASNNVFLTALGNGIASPITGTNRGGGTGDENPVARLRSTLTKLLGGDDSLTMTTSQAVDLDAYQEAPPCVRPWDSRSPSAAGGSVVNADVAQHLIEYQDPIECAQRERAHSRSYQTHATPPVPRRGAPINTLVSPQRGSSSSASTFAVDRPRWCQSTTWARTVSVREEERGYPHALWRRHREYVQRSTPAAFLHGAPSAPI